MSPEAEFSESSSTLVQERSKKNEVSWRALGKYFGADGSFPCKRIQGHKRNNIDFS